MKVTKASKNAQERQQCKGSAYSAQQPSRDLPSHVSMLWLGAWPFLKIFVYLSQIKNNFLTNIQIALQAILEITDFRK